MPRSSAIKIVIGEKVDGLPYTDFITYRAKCPYCNKINSRSEAGNNIETIVTKCEHLYDIMIHSLAFLFAKPPIKEDSSFYVKK